MWKLVKKIISMKALVVMMLVVSKMKSHMMLKWNKLLHWCQFQLIVNRLSITTAQDCFKIFFEFSNNCNFLITFSKLMHWRIMLGGMGGMELRIITGMVQKLRIQKVVHAMKVIVVKILDMITGLGFPHDVLGVHDNFEILSQRRVQLWRQTRCQHWRRCFDLDGPVASNSTELWRFSGSIQLDLLFTWTTKMLRKIKAISKWRRNNWDVRWYSWKY